MALEAEQPSTDVLTVQEAAARLNVSPETTRRWLRTGRLPGTRVAGRWYVRRVDVQADLEEVDADMDAEDLAAIRRGQEDMKAGRFVEWEELREAQGSRY
jgi:excisionase family DNA binding protein